jgi:hypothetical protein
MIFKHFLKRATIDLGIVVAVILFAAISLLVFERYPEWRDEITKRLERQREQRAAVREEREELKGLRTLKGNIEFGPETLTLAELQTKLRGAGSKLRRPGSKQEEKWVAIGWACGTECCSVIAHFKKPDGSLQKELSGDSVATELDIEVPSVADPAEFRSISIAGVHLGESAQDVASYMRQKGAKKLRDDLAQLDQAWYLQWLTTNGTVSEIILVNPTDF